MSVANISSVALTRANNPAMSARFCNLTVDGLLTLNGTGDIPVTALDPDGNTNKLLSVNNLGVVSWSPYYEYASIVCTIAYANDGYSAPLTCKFERVGSLVSVVYQIFSHNVVAAGGHFTLTGIPARFLPPAVPLEKDGYVPGFWLSGNPNAVVTLYLTTGIQFGDAATIPIPAGQAGFVARLGFSAYRLD